MIDYLVSTRPSCFGLFLLPWTAMVLENSAESRLKLLLVRSATHLLSRSIRVGSWLRIHFITARLYEIIAFQFDYSVLLELIHLWL